MKHYFRHLGYYNEVGDIREIGNASADEIIEYWKEGYGAFYTEGADEDADACLEDEVVDGKPFEDFMTDSSGEFIIHNSVKTINVRKEYEGKEDGDCTDDYIDIYQLYKVESRGFEFFRKEGLFE